MRCTTCGNEISNRAVVCTNCGTIVRVDGEPSLRPVSVRESARRDVQGRELNRNDSGYKVALAVLVIVAVLALVFVVAFSFGAASGDSRNWRSVSGAGSYSAASERSSDSASAASSSSASSSASEAKSSGKSSDPAIAPVVHEGNSGSSRLSSSASGEGTVQEQLKRYYKQADSYDKRIASCSTDFNSHYRDSSKSGRQQFANTASALKKEIKADRDAVAQMTVPSWSPYSDTWEDMVELYECLWHRIDCIDQAWGISLSYENPSSHDREILAPIKADQVNGDNKYYTRYKQLYPSIKL